MQFRGAGIYFEWVKGGKGWVRDILQEVKWTLQSEQELSDRAEGVLEEHQPQAGAGGNGSGEGGMFLCGWLSCQCLKWFGSDHLISLGNP